MREYPVNLKVAFDLGDGKIRHLVVTTGALRRLDQNHGIRFDSEFLNQPLYKIVPAAIAESTIEKDITIEDVEELPVSTLEALASSFFSALAKSVGVDELPNVITSQPAANQ
jgi:hypothetical protein